MSVIRKQVVKGTTKWVADLRDIGGGEKWFSTKGLAGAYLKAATADESRGGHANPYFTPTFGEAAISWLEAQKKRIKAGQIGDGEYDNMRVDVEYFCGFSYKEDRDDNGNLVIDCEIVGKGMGYPCTLQNVIPLREMKFTQIRAGKVELFIIPQLLEDFAHKTAKNKYVHLKSILAYAAKAHDLPISAIQDLKFPTQKKKKKKRIKREVVEAVIARCGDTYRGPIKFAAYTGMRFGEIAALTWDKIDFENNLIIVNESIKKGGEIGDPKTEQGDREIPLVPAIRKMLLEMKLASGNGGHLNLVFPTSTGERQKTSDNWRNRGVYATIDKMNEEVKKENKEREKKGLMPKMLFEHFSYHDLRHFYASCLIYESSLPDSIIMRLLGHANYSFTIDQYGHWIADRDRDVELGGAVAAALKAS